MRRLKKSEEVCFFFFNFCSENCRRHIFYHMVKTSLNTRVQIHTCVACLLALCCTQKPQQLILLPFYWSRRHYTRLQAPSSSCLVKQARQRRAQFTLQHQSRIISSIGLIRPVIRLTSLFRTQSTLLCSYPYI